MTPRQAKSLSTCVAEFLRTETSEWETGIAILASPGMTDVTVIIDLDGKPVKNVWNYSLRTWNGCFTASDVKEFSE